MEKETKKIKILNLYASIGGNRELWPSDEIEVTAIEIDNERAAYYQERFQNDIVIIADAHKYLLEHYKEYDFIWSSPPCPTHSDIRRCGVRSGQYEALYPDMKLYAKIILLMNFVNKKTKWIVENVKSYYNPLIRPKEICRHYFWSNFIISDVKFNNNRIHNNIIGTDEIYGFDISKTKIDNKRKALRDMVDPKLGLHIFNCAFKEKQKTLI